MKKDEWPQYEDSFEDQFDDAAIVDSPYVLSCKIEWIYKIAANSKIGKKPGFWKHYYHEALYDAEFVRGTNLKKKYLHLPDPAENPITDLAELRAWCNNPYGHEKMSKKEEKLQREAKAMYILGKNPSISLATLAKQLNVSQSTASRLAVWREHRAKPPLEQFSDTTDSPH